MVRALNETYQFYIFCSNTDLGNVALTYICSNQWEMYDKNIHVWYADKKNRHVVMKKQIDIIAPDVLFIIGLYDADFNIFPMAGIAHPNKIVSARGMLQKGALQMKWLKKNVFLKLFKIGGWHKKISFHATDAIEKAQIRAIFGNIAKIHLAPNISLEAVSVTKKMKYSGELTIISVGLISMVKNQLLVLEALKKIKDQKIIFRLFGPIKEAGYWKKCLHVAETLPNNIQFKYEGELFPEDVTGELKNAHVFLLPSSSENFCHAIAESLGVGLPVITSHFTPWNELEQAKAGLNVALDTASVEEAIRRFCVMEQKEYEEYTSGARQYFLAKVNNAEAVGSYAQMFG